MWGTRCIGADRTHQTCLHTHTHTYTHTHTHTQTHTCIFTTLPTNNPTCRPNCLGMNPGLSAEMPAPNCFRKAYAFCFAHLKFHFCLQGSSFKLSVQRPIYAFSDQWTERIWKEATIGWQLLGRNEKDHERLSSGQLVCGSSCEFTNSWVGMTPGALWTLSSPLNDKMLASQADDDVVKCCEHKVEQRHFMNWKLTNQRF